MQSHCNMRFPGWWMEKRKGFIALNRKIKSWDSRKINQHIFLICCSWQPWGKKRSQTVSCAACFSAQRTCLELLRACRTPAGKMGLSSDFQGDLSGSWITKWIREIQGQFLADYTDAPITERFTQEFKRHKLEPSRYVLVNTILGFLKSQNYC